MATLTTWHLACLFSIAGGVSLIEDKDTSQSKCMDCYLLVIVKEGAWISTTGDVAQSQAQTLTVSRFDYSERDEQACLQEKLMLNKCQNLCNPDGALALQIRDKQSR